MGKKPPMTANEGISCPRNGEGGPKIKVIPRAAQLFWASFLPQRVAIPEEKLQLFHYEYRLSKNKL